MERTLHVDRRRLGAGARDFLIFLALFACGFLVYRLFFAAKPPAPAPAPVIVQNVPPPPATPPVIQPPPAPKAAPIVVAAPAAPPKASFKIAPSLPEKEPESKIVERDLRIALQAAIKSNDFITNETKACRDRVHHSPEFLALKADADAKKSAKDAAAEKLRQDNASGADTDEDVKNLQAASTDWIAAAAKLTSAENDALAADTALTEKEAIYDSASADVHRLKAKLIAEISKAVDDSATDPDCTVRSVNLDPWTWSLVIQLQPRPQPDSAVMADAAVTQIGNILENALCQSPFSWTKAKFTVFSIYKGQSAVEFQARYDYREIAGANFDRLHPKYFDDQGVLNLADRIWLSPVIDSMQNRSQIVLAAAKESPGKIPHGDTTRYDTLVVGGYQRADGSKCPLVFISRPHIDPTTSLMPIIPRKSTMPPSYSATPMPDSVVAHVPDLMTPPD
jgi:hypothetical protein